MKVVMQNIRNANEYPDVQKDLSGADYVSLKVDTFNFKTWKKRKNYTPTLILN